MEDYMRQWAFRWTLMVAMIICLTGTLCGQRVRLFVSDNGTGVDTLVFGYAHLATRCIDASLGEQELPPAPPQGVFDVRFTDPVSPPNACMGQGLKLNLHGDETSWIIDTFKIKFQAGSGGYPIHLSWSGDTDIVWVLTLKDSLGGVVVPLNMWEDTHFDLLDPRIDNLIITGWLYWVGVRADCTKLPESFTISQNYPNPFNPSTMIKYQIPNSNYVSLKIYDVLGREVVTLVDEVQDVGFKSVAFDASQLTSGVYYYRIVAGDFVETRKMVLMR
jgi:hypothetical protein